jgi:hypothetical protein
MMIKTRWVIGALMCLLMIPVTSRAQEQQQEKKSNDQAVAHLRVDIVLTEYDGAKKISSLPYTIYTASEPTPRRGSSNLRMGVRVPVPTGAEGSLSFTYMDVGTNIDCYASSLGDGSYDLGVHVNRSSIYTATQGETGSKEIHPRPDTPVIRNFNTQFDVALRDGETKEGTSATDPLNGHVLKISVTLHVEK